MLQLWTWYKVMVWDVLVSLQQEIEVVPSCSFRINILFSVPRHLPLSLSWSLLPQLGQLKCLSCLWNVIGMRRDGIRVEGKENLPAPSPGPLTAVRVINEAAVSLKCPRSGGEDGRGAEGRESGGVPCVGGGRLQLQQLYQRRHSPNKHSNPTG